MLKPYILEDKEATLGLGSHLESFWEVQRELFHWAGCCSNLWNIYQR